MKHDDLVAIKKDFQEDYFPYGTVMRDSHPNARGDCSTGCKFFIELVGQLGMDWGVCANPESHRCGLLTFEHQGCLKFESGIQTEDQVLLDGEFYD